jgi:hypothetical protein
MHPRKEPRAAKDKPSQLGGDEIHVHHDGFLRDVGVRPQQLTDSHDIFANQPPPDLGYFKQSQK